MAAEWREDARVPLRQVARRPSGFAGDPQREGTSSTLKGQVATEAEKGPARQVAWRAWWLCWGASVRSASG